MPSKPAQPAKPYCYFKFCKTRSKNFTDKVHHFNSFRMLNNREAWLEQIKKLPNYGRPFSFEKSSICELHFEEKYLKRGNTYIVDGKTFEVPYDKVKLTADAIPTIFDMVFPPDPDSDDTNTGEPPKKKPASVTVKKKTSAVKRVRKTRSQLTLSKNTTKADDYSDSNSMTTTRDSPIVISSDSESNSDTVEQQKTTQLLLQNIHLTAAPSVNLMHTESEPAVTNITTLPASSNITALPMFSNIATLPVSSNINSIPVFSSNRNLSVSSNVLTRPALPHILPRPAATNITSLPASSNLTNMPVFFIVPSTQTQPITTTSLTMYPNSTNGSLNQYNVHSNVYPISISDQGAQSDSKDKQEKVTDITVPTAHGVSKTFLVNPLKPAGSDKKLACIEMIELSDSEEPITITGVNNSDTHITTEETLKVTDIQIATSDNENIEKNICKVPGCSKTEISSPGLSFFGIPNEKARCYQWCRSLKIPYKGIPTSDLSKIKICSSHFAHSQFWDSKHTLLKPEAVPSVISSVSLSSAETRSAQIHACEQNANLSLPIVLLGDTFSHSRVDLVAEDLSRLIMPSEDWNINTYSHNETGKPKPMFTISETLLNSNCVEIIRKSVTLKSDWTMKFTIMSYDVPRFSLGTAASDSGDLQRVLNKFAALKICKGFDLNEGFIKTLSISNMVSRHVDHRYRSKKCPLVVIDESGISTSNIITEPKLLCTHCCEVVKNI